MMKKKILIAVVLVAIVAWFVIGNVFMKNYTGTFHLDKNHAWEITNYAVQEGDEDKFDVKISDGNKLKVTYDGEYELSAIITLRNELGETTNYKLRLYKRNDITNDTWVVEADFNKIE